MYLVISFGQNSLDYADFLDELSQKLGTLEALLDNLDRKKAEERNGLFNNQAIRVNGFENDSLDEISSLSGLSSSIQSSIQQDAHQAVCFVLFSH